MSGSGQALHEAQGRPRLRRLQSAAEAVPGLAPPPSERPTIGVLPALRPLVPELPAGALVSVAGSGSAALGSALVAGAAAEDAWCAVVGIPEFGVRAAAGMGADPRRLLLVDDPGRRWAETVAALAEGVDLLLTRSPARVEPVLARRLTAVARRHGCVLVVAGAVWEGTWLHMSVTDSVWTGLSQGHGHLRGRRAHVAARGRGAGGGRQAAVWLPGPDGAVSTVDEVREVGPLREAAPQGGVDVQSAAATAAAATASAATSAASGMAAAAGAEAAAATAAIAAANGTGRRPAAMAAHRAGATEVA